MALEFHPDARGAFDRKANELLAHVHPRPTGQSVRKKFDPGFHVAAHITEADIIGEPRVSLVLPDGTELARYFPEGDGAVGLDGDAYRDCVKLVESIQATPSFRSSVSRNCLLDVVFDWFRDARRLATASTLCEYVVAACEAQVSDREVAVPIAALSVETALPVGLVEIRPLTKDLLDSWFRDMHDRAPQDEASKLTEKLERKRKQLQGLSAAFITVRAEPKRAEELALEETEAALALLRYFAGGSLSARLPCACVPLGREGGRYHQAISFESGRMAWWWEGTRDAAAPFWAISAREIQDMRAGRLDILSELYRSPRTAFQKRIVEAVLLFSRVALTQELSDKLVLLLAALEGLFLKNESEPIQQNLGERLALVTGRDLEERKQILATTKKVYALRSKFVHHAEQLGDVEVLDKFLFYAWCAIFNVISCRDAFASAAEFLQELDDRKLA